MFSWTSFYYVHVMIVSWSKVLEMKLFRSIQFVSHIWLFATPWTAELGFPVHHQLPKPTQIHIPIASVMPPNHLILCHPLPLPPSIFPSIRVFSNESVLHIRWPKYWSFNIGASASVFPMNIQDWFPLGWTGSPCNPRDSQESSPTQFKKHQFFGTQLSL